MKSVTLFLKSILPLLLVLIATNVSWAQYPNPVCSGNGAGRVYFAANNTFTSTTDIFAIDLSKPDTSRPTYIPLPVGSTALAVGTNYGAGPNPTYYTTAVVGGFKYLHYWSGSAWINTTVVMNVDDITGSCGAIIGLDCVNGFIYRWAGGTSTSSAFVGSVATPVSCDVAGDCNGNFYLINLSGSITLRKYSSAGALLQTFAFAGTYGIPGQGLAINGNSVYYDGTNGELYGGVINTATSTVTFSKLSTRAPFTKSPITGVTDFASCGYEGFCLNRGAADSVVACADTARVSLTATGPGPYNWTVVSGPATIAGNGQTVLVTAAGPTVITYRDADCAGANTVTDTTIIFVTSAKVDAGPNHTIIGCRGYFPDTLYGAIADTTPGVAYAYDWTPLGTIISCNTCLDTVIVAPTKDTTYFLTVTTLNGCKWVDSVRVKVADSTPRASFRFIQNFGCTEDTIRFINTTPTNVYISDFLWDFDDTAFNNGNRITSTAISPSHIYKNQGIYSVLLTVSNKYCLDTTRQYVNVLHPLVASFTVKDSACAREQLKFTNTSTYTGTPQFLYTFGDGSSSQLANLSHTYQYSGTYTSRLTLLDKQGCVDTTYRTTVVDSMPFVRFISPDTIVCEGTAVKLVSSYLGIGNTGITVDLGDGTVFQNSDTVTYSYAQADTFHVILTAHYRSCPDTPFKQNIIVNPFPGVNIGPDTVLCPNGSPIILSDRVNINNPAAKYLWNTGDTTASILARDIGTYWARVTLGGCSGTDSLVVNKDCYVDIPNSFTPNGDGFNDYFLPRQFLSRSLNSFKMSIFNRWGQVIYESATINGRGWDGKFNQKDQPQGVYVYIIDVSFDNGVKEHYTGNVTLLR